MEQEDIGGIESMYKESMCDLTATLQASKVIICNQSWLVEFIYFQFAQKLFIHKRLGSRAAPQ